MNISMERLIRGEIPELQVYSIETSDTHHNIDVVIDNIRVGDKVTPTEEVTPQVVVPVIPSVQGEADGLPDGHHPIAAAVDKPTEEVISEGFVPVIPSVQGEADGLPDGHRPIAVDKRKRKRDVSPSFSKKRFKKKKSYLFSCWLHLGFILVLRTS